MIRDILLLKNDLLSENLFFEGYTIFAKVRFSSHHEFVSDDTDGKKIAFKAMVLAEEDFGSHIAWCSAGIRVIDLLPNTRVPKINQSNIAILIKN